MSMVAAAAATSRCPGRFWGRFPEDSTPSPPRYFTFEPLGETRGPVKVRRKCRRVLYPPAVRRPLPSHQPDAAKRLLLLLLALVGAQIYHAPDDVIADALSGSRSTSGSRSFPMPQGPQIPAGNSNGTTSGAPMGAACPSPWAAPPGDVTTFLHLPPAPSRLN